MSTGGAIPGSAPLGSVTWSASPVVAELFARDSWRVTIGGADDPELASSLAELYRDAYRGPADGAYGYRILADLAATTGGVLAWAVPPRTQADASD